MIKCGHDVGGILETKHRKWQQDAEDEGKRKKEKLLGEKAAIVFAVENPQETGGDVEKASDQALDRRNINMNKKRIMEENGDYTLQNIIA